MSYLMARPLIANHGKIRLWVGLFNVATVPTITFSIGGKDWQPTDAEGLFPIRDETNLAGEPRNYQGVYTFASLVDNQEHCITVAAGRATTPFELRVKSLPAKVSSEPRDSFKILLASCYCVSTDKIDVGAFVDRLKIKPDIALFAGDQVYLDQPPAQTMPSSSEDLRGEISSKYRRNWLSGWTDQTGLQKALAKAPAICLPDDHEYWNNYPWEQFWKRGTQHKPTATGLNDWDDAARELFQDFQLGGKPGTQQPYTTLDIDPLCLLFVDTRSHRLLDFDSPIGLMPATANAALVSWKDKLISHQRNGNPHIGLLATGQSLLSKPSRFPRLKDAELANYEKHYSMILDVLEELAVNRIQVVLLTGDVHWNRVAQAHSRRTFRTCLTEVICSPSSLCEIPVLDQWASIKNKFKSYFGADETWFRHFEPEELTHPIGKARQFLPDSDRKTRWKGNHIAIIEFVRLGGGVSMNVTYHPLTSPASLSVSTGPYTLLNT
ncbi:hypothetical protein LMG26684_04602 [Achromobacter mucicolens]|uniref:alkaline phosphatase D family protein n=1 Tax=Achromobacter mucicolens TaxID=1389922 RepID=UPI0014693BAD|nr:alkaline phosphatase D family protein [Achromobacter mucicolens]CAB3900984.1 hypothetical protein LMG26684_04602 [Achromobacter mucicolens]